MQVLQRARIVDGRDESSILLEDDVLRATLEAQAGDGQRVEQDHVGGEISMK